MAWAPDYITADDLGDFLGIEDDDDDVELQDAVSAASRALDDCTRRQFGLVAAPEARRYVAQYNAGEWVLDIDDAMTTTGLLLNGAALVDPDLRPLNAPAKGKPWTRLVLPARPTVAIQTVTMRWGWTTVPSTVVTAAKLQGSRFFARRHAPFGVAGSPDAGSEVRLLAKADPDVIVMLRSYVRRAVPR
jgi:hypothetical protein